MCQKCNPSRTGASWDAFLAHYKIADIHNRDGGWTVISNSGHSYRVRSITKVNKWDGGLEFRMDCDCPSHKRCRHIDAVMAMREAEEAAAAYGGDTDGIEIIERTEI